MLKKGRFPVLEQSQIRETVFEYTIIIAARRASEWDGDPPGLCLFSLSPAALNGEQQSTAVIYFLISFFQSSAVSCSALRADIFP